MYNFEVEHVAEEILRRKAKRVLLQFPEGLRGRAFSIARELGGKVEAEILVSGDPCYGACDLPLWQSRSLGVDLIVHYGHSPLLGATSPPVFYVEAWAEIGVEEAVRRAIPLLGEAVEVGLTSTVQHLHQLPRAEKVLAGEGKKVLIGERIGGASYPGQVLGCDYSSPLSISGRVEVYFFIGGGEFHPLGLSLATGKDVVTADPYTGRVGRIVDRDRMRMSKRRWAAISRARQAKRFGIIVGLKAGQQRHGVARALKGKIEERGGEALLLCMGEINYGNLANFTEIEAFIETACPRIAIDGVEELRKPLLTEEEALVMLGEMEWERVWLETFRGFRGN